MQLESAIHTLFQDSDAPIAAVYLYGSSVSNSSGSGSDVDIGILFDPAAIDQAAKSIENILMQLPRVLRRDVHPVVMNTAGEELLRQIFRKGKCVIVKDNRILTYFKMTAFARIANFSYYRQMLQEGVVKRFTEERPVG